MIRGRFFDPFCNNAILRDKSHFNYICRDRQERNRERVSMLLRVNQEDMFQDRFKSEPVNDMQYFVTLLRYIHQNPTKAGIVGKVGDYDWSSRKEYTSEVPAALSLCATNAILKRMSFDDLKELVEDKRNEIIISCLERGAGMRQLSRLTGVTYGVINRIKGKM